jgi:hypothetical protein
MTVRSKRIDILSNVFDDFLLPASRVRLRVRCPNAPTRFKAQIQPSDFGYPQEPGRRVKLVRASTLVRTAFAVAYLRLGLFGKPSLPVHLLDVRPF